MRKLGRQFGYLHFFFRRKRRNRRNQGDADGTYYPIPIRSLFIGDKTLGGLEAPDSNANTMVVFAECGRTIWRLLSPAFNPLYGFETRTSVMTAKVTKVVLECPTLNTTEEFELTTPNACCGCLTMAVGSCPKKHLLNLAKKMGLDIKRIRKEITEPRKKATINKAVIHQNRIKFHAKPT